MSRRPRLRWGLEKTQLHSPEGIHLEEHTGEGGTKSELLCSGSHALSLWSESVPVDNGLQLKRSSAERQDVRLGVALGRNL